MTPAGCATGPLHLPVLVDRVVALLAPALDRPGAVVVDATVGLGGHAGALLRRCPHVRLVGLDRDPAALAAAADALAAEADRVELRHAVFDAMPAVLGGLGIERVDGVLFDLGVSSPQLDEAGRGFSYARDVRLDMRMDQTGGHTAADVLNSYPVDRLARILREYGEERYARRIARAVVAERERAPFDTSARLAELVRACVPAPARRTGGHPAKRTFQALRIEVNDELAVLERAVPAAIGRLGLGGRIAVLAYHSLEDRLVKRTFAGLARPSVPDGVPDVPAGHEPVLRLVTRGAEKPSATELDTNPRAASARLRVAERVREPEGGRVSILDSLARTRRESQPYRTPRLTVVPHPAFRPPRMPFVLLVLLLLGAGLVGLLLINTSLQQGSFTLHALRQQTSDLSDRQRSLQQQVAALEAPDHLAAKAGSLGMVANPSPAFLRLSDGAVLGDPVPATAPPVPPPATHAADTAAGDTAAGDRRRGAHDPKPAAKKPATNPKPEPAGNGQQPVRGGDAGPAGHTR